MSFRRKITRRQFIKGAAIAGGAMMMPGMKPFLRDAHAFATSRSVKKFIDPLPQFGAEIPLAGKVLGRYAAGVDYYEMTAGVFRQQLHSQMGPTRLYGYKNTTVGAHAHLGGAIIAQNGTPARLQMTSALPASHIIPFDVTIPSPGNGGARQDRIATHLHGGLVPWTSDGGPFHWKCPDPTVNGSSVIPWLPDNNNALTFDNFYPNLQSARTMWYHDHAIGTTRISAYAGVASGYILQDIFDQSVEGLGFGPITAGDNLILVFQDKVFWNPASDPNYSLYVTGAQPDDLWYPYMYEKAIWKFNGNTKKGAPVPSAIPEFFGDTMLVNGHVFPTHTVKAGMYRIRTLNACNARFLNLKFVYGDANGEPVGGYLAPQVAPVNVWMIGSEAGFLPAPVQLLANGAPINPLNLTPWLQAPAERSDLIVDFKACVPGTNVLLYNDAAGPFPIGAPRFDWYPLAPGNPGAAAILPGFGPNTRTLMQFVVSATGGLTVPITGNNSVSAAILGANPPLPTLPDPVNGGRMLNIPTGTWTHPVTGVTYPVSLTPKNLTLNEVFDIYGRLQQLVGTTVPLVKGTFGRAYTDAPTEMVKYGNIEIWNIFNLTADTHPMHFHLFNVMVLSRRLFRTQGFSGIPVFTGPGRGPDLGEEGWKETVKMWPGECTTVAVLVEDPMPASVYTRATTGPLIGRPTVAVTNAGGTTYTGTLPVSPRITLFAGMPPNPDEYVWHCHILEHEEHDMMRPLIASY